MTRGNESGGPPVTGQPYSAEATTESVQTLSDGNHIRRNESITLYPDSEGRTRREAGGTGDQQVWITDPVAAVRYVLRPANKTGQRLPNILSGAFGSGSARRAMVVRQQIPVPGDPPPNGSIAPSGVAPGPGLPRLRSKDLGSKMIEGGGVVGPFITTTLDAEHLGADRDVEITFERWQSPNPGVDILTIRKDPRRRETTYRLSNINRTEPLRSLFEPPTDYNIDSDLHGGGVFLPQRFELPF